MQIEVLTVLCWCLMSLMKSPLRTYSIGWKRLRSMFLDNWIETDPLTVRKYWSVIRLTWLGRELLVNKGLNSMPKSTAWPISRSQPVTHKISTSFSKLWSRIFSFSRTILRERKSNSPVGKITVWISIIRKENQMEEGIKHVVDSDMRIFINDAE